MKRLGIKCFDAVDRDEMLKRIIVKENQKG